MNNDDADSGFVLYFFGRLRYRSLIYSRDEVCWSFGPNNQFEFVSHNRGRGWRQSLYVHSDNTEYEYVYIYKMTVGRFAWFRDVLHSPTD